MPVNPMALANCLRVTLLCVPCPVCSATNIVSGQAVGVVVGTGDSAEIGHISKMVNTVGQHTNICVYIHIHMRHYESSALTKGIPIAVLSPNIMQHLSHSGGVCMQHRVAKELPGAGWQQLHCLVTRIAPLLHYWRRRLRT